MYKIAIISSSIRIGRQTPKVAALLEKKLLETNNAKIDLIDLLEFNFPVMEERLGLHPEPPERLQEFSDRIKAADAVVVVSPEYNGSYSSAIKNAVDYLSTEFKRKPCGVVTVSDGDFGGISASHQLVLLLYKMGAYVSPVKLLVPRVKEAFDESGNPLLERLSKGASTFIKELFWITGVIKAAK